MLVLSEDQELLAKTAADFVAEKSPLARVRALRDRADPLGFSRELWQEMARLGWLGIPFPEALGGAGLGLADLAVVLEALGRSLAPEPFVGSVLLAGQALLRGGSEAQQREWIPRLVAGEAILALAHQETGNRFDLRRVATRAERASGGGFRLRGEKTQVLDAAAADAILVVARSAGAERDAGGIGLFLVPRASRGLELLPQSRLDGRGAALLRLDGVELPASAALGDPAGAGDLLEAVVDVATAGLCAEMFGAMARALEMTLEHLKQRRQFGALIATFQALQHRAVDCFIDVELSRSCAWAACRAVDAQQSDTQALVSLAKARCSDAFLRVANEAIQMFGGVGMTDEYDIGFYLKRARAAEQSFGDAAFHRDRWARLAGY